jgi:uncharacterized protein
MMRLSWLGAGLLSLGLGLVGIVLPLLPTVPFLILAAFCFARGSERLHGWLTGHPVLGPPIRDWEERGAIARRAKVLASISMLAVFSISVLLGLKAWILGLQGLCLAGAAAFIWSRPEG